MVDSKSRLQENGTADDRWLRAMRSVGVSEETIDTVVEATLPKPEDLITLADAATRFGLPLGTLKGWVHRGHLPSKDRVTFPAPGGGKLLVDEHDVAYLVDTPPTRGRPTNGNSSN